MKRTMLFLAVGLFALWAQAGSAQAPATTTLTFFEPEAGGTFKVVDNAPKSPARNPESRKYRFSIGDELIFSQQLLNQKGGTRQGTIYGDFKVVKGKTFNDIVVIGSVVYVLNNGDQINAHGVFKLSASDVSARRLRRHRRLCRRARHRGQPQQRRWVVAGRPRRSSRRDGPGRRPASARQPRYVRVKLLVGDAVRAVGLGAEPLVAVLLVGLEVALEPGRPASRPRTRARGSRRGRGTSDRGR